MTDDEIQRMALDMALDGFEDMGLLERARVFLSLAAMRVTLWLFPRSIEEVAESVQENALGSMFSMDLPGAESDPNPAEETFERSFEEARDAVNGTENECGEGHALPCGIDRQCPNSYDHEAED